MWKQRILTGAVIGVLSGLFLISISAQEREGVGERIGEKIDKGLKQLSTDLRQEWAQIRQSVDKMSVQGRVYTRLRWDKGVDVSKLDIEMQDKATVILNGTLSSTAQQRKAVQLAQDTVGVEKVIDKTNVAKPQ